MFNKKFFIITIIVIIIIFILYLIIPWNNLIRYGTKNLVSNNGNLTIKESKIYNKYNEPVQLRGLSSHGLQWNSDLLTYDNLKYLRDEWEINVFRLAMYTEENGYISDPSIKSKLIEITNYLINLDMYIVIDWHILSDGNPLEYVNEAKDFFADISYKYADFPNIIYEICNEPNNVDWDNSIKPYAEQIIPIIRSNSPSSIIIVGTPNWSSSLDVVIDSPLNFSNIAYAFHFYAGSHNQSSRNTIKSAIDNNICIFVSEWGTTDFTGNGKLYFDSAIEWLNFLNSNKISWINWSFSNKDESSAILKPVQITNPQDIDNNLTESGTFIKSHVSTIHH